MEREWFPTTVPAMAADSFKKRRRLQRYVIFVFLLIQGIFDLDTPEGLSPNPDDSRA
jgi:hypothetical protein